MEAKSFVADPVARHHGEMPVFVNNRLVIPDDELEWRFTRSGGSGGQHANKVSTRVELSWDVEASKTVSDRERARLRNRLGPVVKVVADDFRSQYRNRVVATERLAEKCRAALAPPPKKRKPTKPSAGSKRRRLDSKRRTAQTKKMRRRPSMDD